ncbi:GTPase MTG2, mitochondrial [Fulvia fulva]|uniref:GTPase MTG2, mitochondrial n=1 Tax=Passalora fulva TaxID=5499 RepID=A0A9Q8PIK0_PASFU|nr:GTPase MTG2, mitochondrial [Fulvia fulva]KAK4626082.1 GTPase MTG2, mitochondrial [Fulvia fulva]KAK4627730.1 GTPase MTG2, mitochondrial [Fulvia fulva]UJO23077.1 GTPase MTG2, mitochondrial [Fulvia fulva]WPV13444.1 GTPase MTG2, mitochondrial [Fulvia fulva]WPV29342.1 GTPase MTG2, mitochondrial [Fulvia fulva]
MSCCALPRAISNTCTPFLYPCLDTTWRPASTTFRRSRALPRLPVPVSTRSQSTATSATHDGASSSEEIDVRQSGHLDPAPSDYSAAPFTDACTLSVSAGSGGHGCISFLREKYIANGPPNGGDGGTGGSVYIQAIKGETSLHKLARRGTLKASRGRNGQGSLKGGARGEDLLITVPVGTVVRELSRVDPLAEQQRLDELAAGRGDDAEDLQPYQRDKFLIYPGFLPKAFSSADFPRVPRARKSTLTSLQPPAPLRLDLDKPMQTPMLLAAGAMGGLGNPHFVTRALPRPKFSTKGDDGMRINLQLELKLLADVGLVGLPNAGKSTLLRALTKSRTRVGNWAFTTLNPNIGTVILDSHTGRPVLDIKGRRKEPRTNFTIADIPGLIEGAHLDRGLGLGFLRHIERAAVLAFVLDLSARDAIEALKGLWREVGAYEKIREQELNADTERVQPQEDGVLSFKPFESSISPGMEPESASEHGGDNVLNAPAGRALPPLLLPPISSKPWLVVATKADLPETQKNFQRLHEYLTKVQAGEEEHPSCKKNAWRNRLHAVPVSAINKQGVSGLPEIILGLLDD